MMGRNYLNHATGLGTGWFGKARGLAMAISSLAAGIGAAILLAVGFGFVRGDLGAWLGFSLLPFLALVFLQVLARMQANLTMRFGGRSVHTEGRTVE